MEGVKDRDLMLLATRGAHRGRAIGYARKCAARVELYRRGLYRAPTPQETAAAREYRPARAVRFDPWCHCLAPRVTILPDGVSGPVPGRGTPGGEHVRAGCIACGKAATPHAVLVSTGLGGVVGRT